MIESSELGFDPSEFAANQEIEGNVENSEAERIRESARNLRFELLQTDWERIKGGIDSLLPKSAQVLSSSVVNYTPIGIAKMVGEGIAGKTIAGQELTPLGRLNHFILQGLNVYAHYVGIAEHKWGAAGLAYGASWVMDAVQYYPPIISALRDLAQRGKMDGVAENLGKLENVLDKHVSKLFFKEGIGQYDGPKTETK